MMRARLQATGEADGLSRSPCRRYRRHRGARHGDGWRADRGRRRLPWALYRSGGSRSLCVPQPCQGQARRRYRADRRSRRVQALWHRAEALGFDPHRRRFCHGARRGDDEVRFDEANRDELRHRVSLLPGRRQSHDAHRCGRAPRQCPDPPRAPTAHGRPPVEWRTGAGMAAYTASKAAVAALTVALAEEVVKAGILVNAIAPSTMDTPANRRTMPTADHAAWAKVDEVAATILFLASPEN